MPRSSLRIAAAGVACVLVAVSLVVFGADLEGLVAAAGAVVLVAVTVTDVERRIVPNRIIVPALAATLVVQLLREPRLEWPVAALLCGGFLLAAALAYPAGMGMGDVKLAAFLGAWIGWASFVALMAGMLAALVPAFWLLATRGAAGRKASIPFAPFLALGGLVALFAGDALLDRWLST